MIQNQMEHCRLFLGNIFNTFFIQFQAYHFHSFVPADKALILASITSSKEERCRLIADSFAAALNCEEARNVHHYEERNWGEDQFCGGGYMATPHPGFLVRFGSHLRLPVGRMHFAGTECSTSWAGTVKRLVVKYKKVENYPVISKCFFCDLMPFSGVH